MQTVYEKSVGLTDTLFTFCPGCTHGVIIKLIAESMVELGIVGETVGVSPVGCSVLTCDFFACDMVQAPHGRAPAVATGLSRALPGAPVFTYQGDGDLAGIGLGEAIHAASRGERMSMFFINNATYGMTGGQMAPTTLPGQKTQTTPYGRDVAEAGYPIKMSEIMATLDGAAFVQRVTVTSVPHIRKAKQAIKRAFQLQLEEGAFSFIEIVSTCPTNWGVSPVESLSWLEENMLPHYPLRMFKDIYKRDE